MKKLPLLICCVLGLILLPWHFILPEGEAPHPEASELAPPTLVKYREELAAKGVQDPRLDDFVILELVARSSQTSELKNGGRKTRSS